MAVRPNPGEAARSCATPIIAAVDGHCLTGGLELALSCSFLICTARARFADTHAVVRAFPSWGMTALLPAAIGVRRARQMMLTNEFIDAYTARDWGLANEVVEPDHLLERALALAAAISRGVVESKRRQLALLARTDGFPLSEALEAEAVEAATWDSPIMSTPRC